MQRKWNYIWIILKLLFIVFYSEMVDTLYVYPHRAAKRERPGRGLKLGKGNDKEASEYDEETER